MTKIALVTGASGQDGSYLVELLCAKKYIVHAQSRQIKVQNQQDIQWHYGDMSSADFVRNLITTIQPDEVYNLCSLSSPHLSWNSPLEAGIQNALVPHLILDTVKTLLPTCRVYQASSSEIFGNSQVKSQNEFTPVSPKNPYAIAKLYAHQLAKIYRENYNLFVCSGILFNHESPRRSLHHASQKITYAAACIANGIKNSKALNELNEPIVKNGKLTLGTLDVSRDFGYAKDYVEAMWLMLQQSVADDYVIGTGESHSLQEFCEIAFLQVGLNWQDHVEIDARLTRLVDSQTTMADSSKARKILGWQAKTSFADLVKLMLAHHQHMLAMEQA